MTSPEPNDKLSVPIEDIPFTTQTLITLAGTPVIPARYAGKVNEMLAAVLYGREIGIGPISAMNELYMVDGKVSMSGQLMSRLVHQRGHQLRIRLTQKASVVEAWRRDPWTHELDLVGEFQFTEGDAARAGLNKKATYENYPQMMRTWRAITWCCRTVFADCLGGIGYIPEELDIEDQTGYDIEAIPLDDIDIIDETTEREVELDNATAEVAAVMEVDAVTTLTKG